MLIKLLILQNSLWISKHLYFSDYDTFVVYSVLTFSLKAEINYTEQSSGPQNSRSVHTSAKCYEAMKLNTVQL